MEASAGVKQMADLLYQRVYGFNPKEEMKRREREAAQREAAQREAAQRERETIILKLFEEAKITPAHIAALLGHDLEYVERVIREGLDKKAKNMQ